MDTVQAAGSAAERGGDDGAGAQLADFSSWLARERGLSPVTVRCYSKQTRVFLAGLPGPLDAALRGLDDYAVLSLVARLGLRGAEAAGLQLGDVDWRAGEIAVTGKGSRTERLPLPVAAGEALVAWLTGGRPACQSRAVFVTVRRPYR